MRRRVFLFVFLLALSCVGSAQAIDQLDGEWSSGGTIGALEEVEHDHDHGHDHGHGGHDLDVEASGEHILPVLISVILVSLIALIGIFTLGLNRTLLDRILLILVAFGAGAILGGAMFDLVPESLELGGEGAFLYITGGIVIFFIIDKFMHWHHHHHLLKHDHTHESDGKPFAYLNLMAEGIHNFLDGVIIAAAYMASFELGVVATIAIVVHEIPQEIGDFGILVHGGFSVRKALFYNFLVALTAILGAVVMFLAAPLIPDLIPSMISIAAGGFLYISLASLIPELHHETRTGKIILQVLFFVLGITILWYIGTVFHHSH